MNNFSILYIEDDADILENVTFLLNNYMSKVYTAKDGEEALSLYYKYKPDIVISDIEIPKIDGLSVVNEIRKNNKTIPIIMMTAHNKILHLSSALDIGVSSYVKKPFTFDRLKEALFKAIEEKKELDKQDNFIEKFSLINDNVIMLKTDINSVVTEVTDAFINLCGYSRDELIGSKASIIRDENTADEIYVELYSAIESGVIWHGELKNRRKDGSYYWVSVTITPLFDSDGDVKSYTSIQVNITDTKIAQYSASTDSLTSLYNRTRFTELVQNSINTAKRYDTYITYIMLDIDYFKEYNDIYGHMKGDDTLKRVAKIFRKYTKRINDYAFRIGGEEFVIIIVGLNREKSSNLLDDMLKDVIALKIEHSGNNIHKFLTISAGYYIEKGESIVDKDTMYLASDRALYSSKHGGRNRVSFSS